MKMCTGCQAHLTPPDFHLHGTEVKVLNLGVIMPNELCKNYDSNSECS